MTLDPVTGGGTVERTFQMSRFLAKAGAECTILTTDSGLTDERRASLPGVRIVALPCLVNRFHVPRFSFRAIEEAVGHADIIHLMNHWTVLNALVYVIARRLKKPYVVCPAGTLAIYGRSKVLKLLYNWAVGKALVRHACRQIAVTADEVRQFRPYGIGPETVSIIPNGIDMDEYVDKDDTGFRSRHDLGSHPFILFVGRLNHIKGPDLLLRAYCNAVDTLKDYHLAFVGPDGGMLSELQAVADSFGVRDRVHFLGYLGGAEKSQAYPAAELLVIPSRQEAMSVVVLEAGATGTPVLLTDQCGFEEIDRMNGGKVVPASVEGLQRGLVELLEDSTKLRSMGANLEKLVRARFRWDSIVNEYITLYSQILRMTR